MGGVVQCNPFRGSESGVKTKQVVGVLNRHTMEAISLLPPPPHDPSAHSDNFHTEECCGYRNLGRL